MSEIKLNLTDSERTLNGTIHCSIADACVAALSAEPETISELEAALVRFINPVDDSSPFAWFGTSREIDDEPWDAGIAVIDLAARVVASISTYSQPGPQGEVFYHDGVSATDISVLYRLPEDWLFLNSIEEYEITRDRRRQKRAATPLFDTREVLYGRPLLEWVLGVVYNSAARAVAPSPQQDNLTVAATTGELASTGAQAFNGAQASRGPQRGSPAGVPCCPHSAVHGETTGSPSPHSALLSAVLVGTTSLSPSAVESSEDENHDPDDELSNEISSLHARWLMAPRDDLQGQSPRDVLLARQEFIDFDLHTRSLQWSLQGEGPPCLATDSFAYRCAGFGTHEWVVYYDLVRHLLCNALRGQTRCPADPIPPTEYLQQLAQLEQLKTDWLEHPQEDFGGKIPALIIENERIRLPIAMRGHDMVIDDDCPVCRMMADDTELGMGVGFWHLDGSHMDDDFAFSPYKTRAEWEAENRRREEFDREFNRHWAERQQRIARGESVEDEFNLDWINAL